MNQRSLRGLLYDALPPPPLELRTPPLDGIRRRVRRRRLAMRWGTASVVLIVAALGIQVVRAAQGTGPVPTSTPPAVDTTGRWTFAVLSMDGRSVTVVSEGPGHARSCDGPQVEPVPSSVPVHVGADRVVLPIPEASLPGCAFSMPVQLDASLGTRTLVDSRTGKALSILHERALPRPTYPSGISADTTYSNIVVNAPRPTWTIVYNLPDGFTITVIAVPANMAPPIEVQEQVSAHARTMRILKPLVGGESIVAWTEGEWQILVDVDPAEHQPLSRDELQRVIDNLVWP